MKMVLPVLLTLSATGMRAQDMSLKGVSQVQVGVEFVDGQGSGSCTEKVLAKNFGLLEGPIQTEPELMLRGSGLRIGIAR